MRCVSDWNERYRSQGCDQTEPEPLLVRYAGLHAPDRALDLACGAGRNAIFLARTGWHVTAVDSAPPAIELLRSRAGEDCARIDARIADLERGEFSIEPDGYALIGDFFYLQRSLFPQIRHGVRRGGLFVATIHMFDDSPGVRPMNPDFLLQPDELKAAFAGWEILHYIERKQAENQRRRAELAARRID